MPFSRPTISSLRTQVAQDVAAALPGSDPLLRFSNLGVMAAVQAALAHLHYGYIDWISQQAQPFTATGEFLEAWGALKGVFRIAAASATGTVTFTGTNGVTILSGTQLSRGDGAKFATTADGTIASGTVTVPAKANVDPGGLLGAFGNTTAGSILTLGSAIAGVNSAGIVAAPFTGGADIETDTSLRARMLLAYQNVSHGGSLGDYILWTLAVAGVTQVWVVPHGFGAGTVVIYPMFGGFPVGTNGCASGEMRDTPASGNQLAVANYIFPLQPVTALVYVVAPTANTIAFTISGISGASTITKAAIAAAIANVFTQQGTAIGSTVALSAIEAAIAAIPGTAGFVIASPLVNIVSPVGKLPVLGLVTYT